MKHILSSLFIIGFTLSSLAKNGTISGTVISDQGYPIPNANVIIKGTNQGTNTNNTGTFNLSSLSSGKYSLEISYVGFRSKTLQSNVTDNQTVDLGTIILIENREVLNEVVLEAEQKNKFYRAESEAVSKLPLKDIENPQVYNTIPSKLLEEQVVTNFESALKNAPGIYKLWESTGRGGDGGGYY